LRDERQRGETEAEIERRGERGYRVARQDEAQETGPLDGGKPEKMARL